MDVGRSDGGLVGDSLIQLYRPSWRVRQHLLFQVDFFNQMQEAGFYEYLHGPFVFSLISDTQYYFLQTTGGERDAVYHFDSNSLVVTRTKWDLVGFVEFIFSNKECSPGFVTQGDLLLI
ncbi:SMI1/KNR4 family protein [Pseudomonas gingeri]|nr:SMI1/KNR4 family protein [Pseudomonas gingeri]